MKKNLILVIIFALFFCTTYFAQSIAFNQPQNGVTYTGTGSWTTVSVYCDYGFSLTPLPIVVIGNYAKLIIDGSTSYSSQGGVYIPNNLNLSAGTHTLRMELYEWHLGEPGYYIQASQDISIDVKFTIYAANNFGSGSINLENTQTTSGASTIKYIGESVSVGAIDQSDGTYNRIWNTSGTSSSISNWKRNGAPIGGATSRDYSYTVASNDNGVTLTADLKKNCNVSFQNSMPGGAGNTGDVWVDGTQQNVTYSTQRVEQNSISFSADNNQSVIDGLIPVFDHWSDNSTSSSRNVTINSHTSYTAYYKGKPSTANRSLQLSSTIGDPVTLTWIDNPSPYVTQYKIYRKVRPSGGQTGSEVLLATVSSGTQTYTDYDYVVSNYSYYQLYYDVREYNPTDGLASDPSFVSTFAEVSQLIANGKNELAVASKEIPTEYSISNYPNPFNPTTTINYQLPKDGVVTLKVYDILGKEVATLVNESKQAGYYNASFDAGRLSSGIYIYTISVNGYVQSKKMLLMK